MTRRMVSPVVAILILLTAASPVFAGDDAPKALSRGAQWVRTHPFTIMGLSILNEPVDAEQYRDAGMSAMLAWRPRESVLAPAAKIGLPWHCQTLPRRWEPGLIISATEMRELA